MFFCVTNPFLNCHSTDTDFIYKVSFMKVYLTLLKLILVTTDVISKKRRILKKWMKILMPFKLFAFHLLKYFDVNFVVVTAPSEPANPISIS